MSNVELLLWVRGPAFQIAVAVFVIGMVVRLLEIFLLGRKPDLAQPRNGGIAAGWRTIVSRSAPDPGTFKREPVTLVAGYIFHIGFFVTLVLFAPHIELFRAWLGLSWPALSTPVVDATAVITMLALVVTLVHRLRDPVRKFLSRFEDYFTWLVTLLPVVTGYLAYHRLLVPYALMLAVHILTVELLLVVFPFTKLTHAFTLFAARWYNGYAFGRKGVQS